MALAGPFAGNRPDEPLERRPEPEHHGARENAQRDSPEQQTVP